MPTILRAHGLRFVIFTEDHAPPHVHVSGRGGAKIAIDDPQAVIIVRGMSKPDVACARDVVREHRDRFLDIWTQFHG